jgi:arginine decarboxylase
MPALDQASTPLLEAILRYNHDEVLAFHTPGHKKGKGMHARLADLLGARCLELDLGLTGGIDSLNRPTGCIRDAQRLAAELYGADETFFLINGTTCGVAAMVLAAARPGEKVLVPRNAHRSVVAALLFSGTVPAFFQPVFDDETAQFLGVTPEAVEEALAAHPDARAVVLTNPTYYGASSDLEAIAARVHARGMLLLVDEAHGPHLRFDPRLPRQAIDAGADAAVQSTHKVLGGLSQCSMLHCKGPRLDARRVQAMLQLLQTTSPNYILLASLDVARMDMATGGQAHVARSVDLAEDARARINRVPGLRCFGRERVGQPGVHALDVTKLTVTVSGLGLSGYQAEELLRFRYRAQPEMSDAENVLCFVTLADTPKDVDRLVDALRRMADDHRGAARRAPALARVGDLFRAPPPPQRLSPRDAYFARARAVPLAEAAGAVSAETIVFYPPGIPALWPGQEITPAVIQHCLAMLEGGARATGPEDPSLRTVRTVAAAPASPTSHISHSTRHTPESQR